MWEKISDLEVNVAVIQVEPVGFFHKRIGILSLAKRSGQHGCEQTRSGNSNRVFPKIASECGFTPEVI